MLSLSSSLGRLPHAFRYVSPCPLNVQLKAIDSGHTDEVHLKFDNQPHSLVQQTQAQTRLLTGLAVHVPKASDYASMSIPLWNTLHCHLF